MQYDRKLTDYLTPIQIAEYKLMGYYVKVNRPGVLRILIHRDDTWWHWREHCHDGPAVMYPDGNCSYFLYGVAVSKEDHERCCAMSESEFING